MKFTIILFLAVGYVSAESDKTLETAISFVKDCNGDYFLCVKVIIVISCESDVK